MQQPAMGVVELVALFYCMHCVFVCLFALGLMALSAQIGYIAP